MVQGDPRERRLGIGGRHLEEGQAGNRARGTGNGARCATAVVPGPHPSSAPGGRPGTAPRTTLDPDLNHGSRTAPGGLRPAAGSGLPAHRTTRRWRGACPPPPLRPEVRHRAERLAAKVRVRARENHPTARAASDVAGSTIESSRNCASSIAITCAIGSRTARSERTNPPAPPRHFARHDSRLRRSRQRASRCDLNT